MSSIGSCEETVEGSGIHLTTRIIQSTQICTWEIQEFASYKDIFQLNPAQSEEFTSNFDYNTKFQLTMFLSTSTSRQSTSGYHHERSERNFVKLKIMPSANLQKCTIETFLETGSQNVKKVRYNWINNKENNDIKALGIDDSSFQSMELTDSLLIKCIINEFYISNEENPDFHSFKLSSDFEKLLEKKILTDFTFNVGNESFHVHKCILAARSRVFYAMFNQDVLENSENVVNIPDINPTVFKEMLRFIYTGMVENINPVAIDLLRAADKYEIEELKTHCEKVFCNVSIREAPSILILADRHNARVLKEKTLKFIKQNIKQVLETEEFLQVYTHKDLIQEIFKSVVSK